MREKKTMVIYGDSLSTGTHGEGGYVEQLADFLGISQVENYAVGSSSLTLGSKGNMNGLIEEGKIHSSADLILIWHGTNDWYWGHPIGKPDSRSLVTFYGSVFHVMEKLREASPSAMIIWVTPLYRREKPYDCMEEGNAHILKNRVGHTLSDYADALEKCSSILGFPLIEMHRLSGIHASNAEEYLEDGVHPNMKGYERILRVLEREILRIL